MPNTPAKRPDVEGIAARVLALRSHVAISAHSVNLIRVLAHQDIPALIAYIEALEKEREKLEAVVAEQAADDGLWFQTDSIVEAYFQQELRRLHEIIEGKTSAKCAVEALATLGDGDG